MVRRLPAALALVAALTLTSCTGADDAATSPSGEAVGTPAPTPAAGFAAATDELPETPTDPVVVGSADFPESRTIAQIYALALEDAGITVRRDFRIGARELYLPALDDGEVDIVPEYIGSLTETLNRVANGEDADTVATGDVESTLTALRGFLEPFGGVVLDPSSAQSQNAFAVRARYAERHGLTTLSDLAALNGRMVGGGPRTCATYATCLPGLQDVYSLEFADFVELDTGGPRTLDALDEGTIDVGLVFSADGSVAARGFVVLEDDRELQVAENVTALMRADVASQQVRDTLDEVNRVLRTADLRSMNRRVKHRGLPVRYVAASWAAEAGLIDESAVPERPAPTPDEMAAQQGWERNAGEPSARAQSLNWAALADCESTSRPYVISANGLYHGLFQFTVSTWQSVGGTGAASSATPEEQKYRAMILFDRAGSAPWPSCGVRL